MALVLADQVRAGRPRGHVDLDLRPAAAGNRGFDFDVVGVGRREAERVTNRLERLSAERDARDKRTQARDCKKKPVF